MDSEIKKFYSGLNILITGATGLLGQLVAEKLLRVCPDVSGIYLILRDKRGKTATERIMAAYQDPVFNKLREVYPDFTEKIHVLKGECSHLKLGLDNPSRQTIIDKINVIFHCAASLNMEAKLEDAVNTNIRSLNELLAICREMKNLKSMVFVSTSYSNCIYNAVEEKFYPPPLKPDTIIKLTEEVDSNVLSNITPMLRNKWPNTYCYSKAIAEDLIQQHAGILPVTLFRPSVIMPTCSEPVPGWTSNLYGPIGFFLASGLGICRVSYCNPHGKIDFVPADYCANALICTAWETHKKFQVSASHVPIYNYTAGRFSTISIKLMTQYAACYEFPFKNAVWATICIHTNYKLLFYILEIFFHYIPGYLTDFYFYISGKPARMIKSYGKLSKMSDVLSFFTCHEWNFSNTNVYKLWNTLNETDKQLFPFNMSDLNFKEYLMQCALGIKVYILKENLDNVEEEKRNYQKLVKLHNTVKAILFIVIFVLFYTICSMMLNVIV